MSEASSLASDATIFVNDGGSLKQAPLAVLSGAMTGSDATALHFKGVYSELPDNPAEFTDGDVVLVGDKEYVYYGDTFFELGDASGIAANAANIVTLNQRVSDLEDEDRTLNQLTILFTNADGEEQQAAYNGEDAVMVDLSSYATKADVNNEVTDLIGDAVHGMVKSVNGISPDTDGNIELSGVVKSVNGIEPDNSGDVELRITGTVKSVNGVAPDENGNVTIALTEGGEGTGIASVVQTTTSTEDGGTNIVTVTLTSGATSTFQVMNGSQGSPGDPGYTPVRGTDYWTDADKSEIINDVLVALPTAEGVAF